VFISTDYSIENQPGQLTPPPASAMQSVFLLLP